MNRHSMTEVLILPIPGFSNYLCGSDGTIWSSHGKALSKLQPRTKKCGGYLAVNLCEGGKKVEYYVHKLVMMTFVGPCPENQQVCHYPNFDKTCNELSNLRYDTPKENARDAWRDRPPRTEKACSKCKEVKPNSQYYRSISRTTSDGLKGICTPCQRSYSQRATP